MPTVKPQVAAAQAAAWAQLWRVLLAPADGLLDDSALDPDQRDVLADCTTPRRGIDGELCWLIDEIEVPR